jgi:DNA/RNA endonuclease YhcR with UshA esterase domain
LWFYVSDGTGQVLVFSEINGSRFDAKEGDSVLVQGRVEIWDGKVEILPRKILREG